MEDTYRDTLLEGHSALLRTSESLARSQQAALEAETIGTSVAEELDCQRETLLRARDRLTDTDYELTRSRQLLRMIDLFTETYATYNNCGCYIEVCN